ncbi:hypothetical protein BY458DRAFT_434295 [Sporodiniella umbellata]|nr:hypothetical protein BY458DRAFT_434295 [Sporodiniella umbellata]
MVAVILFAVTGYVFKEWVIRTAAQLETKENEAPRRASGANTLQQDQEQLRIRLEQLSRELESRNQARRPSFTMPSVSDDFFAVMSAPNGAQSPFAAWRDYQQQTTPSFTQTRTWRAREFNNTHQITEREDYFGHQDIRPPEIQPPLNLVEREEEEAAFDFIESKDKILETMGIYGSPWNLLKTPFLMSIMISLCLGITVWVPYIIGQTFLLGLPSIDRVKYITHWIRFKPLLIEAMFDPWTETWESIKIGLSDSMIRYKTRDPATITLNVVAGYFILILMGSWYLDHAGSQMSRTSLQQRTVWKVLLFILLELILFPTSCGLFLDLSTLPYFQASSLVHRLSFLQDSPCSGIFLYWFTGTGFIQLFLEVISHVREVVRPGVLWFIRDPHDPEFHPMQELIRQPIRHLLWRFVCHVAIYFLLIMVGMGCVGIVVCKVTPVCPILWTFDIPWSTLPLDLLAVPFLVPRAMKHVLPREFSKRAVMTWWHIVARVLQLSSFMFGQQGEIRSKSGYVARVPAYDRTGYHGSRPMVVPVEAHTGIPLNERERRLGHPAGSGPGQTTIVHIPPLFYPRMIVFLLLIWFTGSILVCSMAFVPLLFGRHVLVELLGFKIAHDVYPFAAGACLMMGMSALFNAALQYITFLYQSRGKIDLRQFQRSTVCAMQQVN